MADHLGVRVEVLGNIVLRFTATSAATIVDMLGVVFLAAIWTVVHPISPVRALATAIGVPLILKAALVLITSIEFRIIRAALPILWVGLLALFRGMTEVGQAFELKRAVTPLTPAGLRYHAKEGLHVVVGS